LDDAITSLEPGYYVVEFKIDLTGNHSHKIKGLSRMPAIASRFHHPAVVELRHQPGKLG